MVKTRKLTITCLLSIALLLGLYPADCVSAVKKVSLSSKKITITEGMSKTLKVKNAKKTVKWKIVYGKNYIVLQKKGKTARIKGRKQGKAKIQATVGNKRMTCNIIVKSKNKNFYEPAVTAPMIANQSNENGTTGSVNPLSSTSTPLPEKSENPSKTAQPGESLLPPEESSTPPKTTAQPEESLLPPEENSTPPETTARPKESLLPPENTIRPEASSTPLELLVEYSPEDIEPLWELIQLQTLNGAIVSEDITDSEEYVWEDGRLVGIRWEEKKLTGALDVSKCTALTRLECGNNQLEELKVEDCVGLRYLDCSDNQLMKLDLTKCSVLEYLSCGGNQLEDLDVSTCGVLKDLFCDHNRLDSLTIENQDLQHLWCFDNCLSSLDLKSEMLSELHCKNNKLDILDLSSCTSLSQFTCDENTTVMGYISEEQTGAQLTYQAHVQQTGWMEEVAEGEIAGTTGKSKRLEGLIIHLKDTKVQGEVRYRAHVAEQGWQDWKTSGELSGTTGKNQAIEAVEICLTGELAEKYDIYYRLHLEQIGWLGWAKNGEMAGSTALSIESQAVQIRLVPKNEKFDTICDAVVKRPTFTYQAYCQNQGWQDTVKENSVAGTTGKSLRLEALKLNVSDTNIKGTVQYRVHVSDIGWQDWKSSGELAGTTGKSKAIEAVQIQLSSEMAAVFDIYYRVYSAEIGWLGWAKNGAYAGTTGGGLRAEAIQVVMLNKGANFSTGAAPYRQYTSSANGDLGFVVRTSAPEKDNAYYYSRANSFFPSYAPYPGTLDATGNCTWYAFGRAYEILKSRPNLSINGAGKWYDYNKNNRCYDYGSTPRQGAIVCWSNHVAVVEKVNTDGTILISESSYKGYYPQGFLFRTRTVSASNPNNSGDTFYGYIYIK